MTASRISDESRWFGSPAIFLRADSRTSFSYASGGSVNVIFLKSPLSPCGGFGAMFTASAFSRLTTGSPAMVYLRWSRSTPSANSIFAGSSDIRRSYFGCVKFATVDFRRSGSSPAGRSHRISQSQWSDLAIKPDSESTCQPSHDARPLEADPQHACPHSPSDTRPAGM